MKSPLRLCALFAALIALAAYGAPARAAQVTQITWDVTGGNYKGFAFAGSITGGSLTWAPASPLSTPGTTGSGTATLIVTGTNGYFKAVIGASYTALPANITASRAYVTAMLTGYPKFYTGTSPANVSTRSFGSCTYSGFCAFGFAFPTIFGTEAGAYLASANGRIILSSSHSTFSSISSKTLAFILGNEVRTTSSVPEPSTTALVSLGLLGLAGVGGIGARLRRG